jgi:pSer/pThr/pTyr-binding forkhead associated (FHA) protein
VAGVVGAGAGRCRFGDKRISARHCRLYRERDASAGHYVVVLEDLSSNGTFVNGTKVVPVEDPITPLDTHDTPHHTTPQADGSCVCVCRV